MPSASWRNRKASDRLQFKSEEPRTSESESEVAQSCPTLCHPVDCSQPGSSVHGIFQARILEWVAISFSRRSSWPRDWTWVSCIVGRHFTIWATREVPNSRAQMLKPKKKWVSPLKDREREREREREFTLPPPLCSSWALSSGWCPPPWRGWIFSLSLLTQMLKSSRNTLIDTSGKSDLPTISVSLGPVKLTYRVNHHNVVLEYSQDTSENFKLFQN